MVEAQEVGAVRRIAAAGRRRRCAFQASICGSAPTSAPRPEQRPRRAARGTPGRAPRPPHEVERRQQQQDAVLPAHAHGEARAPGRAPAKRARRARAARRDPTARPRARRRRRTARATSSAAGPCTSAGSVAPHSSSAAAARRPPEVPAQQGVDQQDARRSRRAGCPSATALTMRRAVAGEVGVQPERGLDAGHGLAAGEERRSTSGPARPRRSSGAGPSRVGTRRSPRSSSS